MFSFLLGLKPDHQASDYTAILGAMFSILNTHGISQESAQRSHVAVFCCSTLPISFRVSSLALGQSYYDCPVPVKQPWASIH